MTAPINLIWAKLASFYTGFFLALPNLLAAIALLLVAWGIARLVSHLIARALATRDRIDLGSILGSLAFGFIIILAILIAAAVVFPSVKPVDIISTLGFGSVAIGFAFKDILQNLLAGLLLLIRRPYRRGDQIVVKGYEGTVEHIESRATLLKTYDGRRVIIPNSDVYTSPVEVNTAFDVRRNQYDVGIGYGDDIDLACRVFIAAMNEVEGVLSDPPAQCLPWELGDNYVVLRARWWAKSLRSDQVAVQARVIRAILLAANEHDIDLPFPTTVMLFHDQTEETDGDRRHQREGWPAGSKPPRSARAAKKANDDGAVENG